MKNSVSLLIAVFVAISGFVGCSDSGTNPDTGVTLDMISADVIEDVAGSDISDDVTVTSDVATDAVGDLPTDLVQGDVQDVADVVVIPPLKVVRFSPGTVDDASELDFTFEATGGEPPYSDWQVIKGELPVGTTLDADTGAWSGQPSADGFYYFVVQVSDSTGAVAPELFGVRVGDPEVIGPMAEMAQNYLDIYKARHDWNGFSYNCRTPDDPDGNYSLSTLGDACFQSGQCTMAMAYRNAVQKTKETETYLKKQVDGWRFFQRLTGVPGLIGRSYGREEWSWEDNHHSDGFWPENPDARNYRGEGEFEGWIWRGDVSRDQATGAVLGMAAAYDMAEDPETKLTAATFLTELVDHVWDNNLDFMDKNDELTEHGNVDGESFEGWPYQNGLNAACSLAWFKIAAHVAENEGLDDASRFQDRYDELISRGYLDFMNDFMWVYDGYVTKHYNTYMAYENMFHLARLEDDPVLGPRVDQIFRDTLWLNLDDNTPNRRGIKEANPVKATWYMYSTGDYDAVALYDALWQLAVFSPAPLRDRYIKNSDYPDVVVNPDSPKESLYPLPSNRQPPDMVIWHRSTFLMDGGVDSGEERTGCDYMLPYWMGRYYGWIDENW